LCGAVAERTPKHHTLLPKDIITSLNGKSTRYFDQIAANRKQQRKTIPQRFYAIKKTENITLIVSKEGKLGVQPGG
jgi:hypothetical protein